MVTAGVFLIIRCSPLFECARGVLALIVVIGAATAIMAATSGLLQTDLKKVIAYSTCSQLGYMIFACGLSGYTASLFHLSTHAFFKALLFLSAGAVIHAVASEQDMRKFGGLARMLPYTYAAFFVGSIALMGVPFLSGFYSKDLILEVAGGAATITSNFAYALGLISAFFTAFYSFRLLFLAFYGESRTARLPLEHTHEASGHMGAALLVLAVGSIFLGIFGRDLFVGPGTDFWNDSIAVGTALSSHQLSGEFMLTGVKLIPLFTAIGATLLVFYVYGAFSSKRTLSGTIPRGLGPYRFFSHKWGFDAVYNQYINRPLMVGAYNLVFSLLDKGAFELVGPTGLGRSTVLVGRQLSAVQTGYVYDYAAFKLTAFLVLWLLFDLFLGTASVASISQDAAVLMLLPALFLRGQRATVGTCLASGLRTTRAVPPSVNRSLSLGITIGFICLVPAVSTNIMSDSLGGWYAEMAEECRMWFSPHGTDALQTALDRAVEARAQELAPAQEHGMRAVFYRVGGLISYAAALYCVAGFSPAPLTLLVKQLLVTQKALLLGKLGYFVTAISFRLSFVGVFGWQRSKTSAAVESLARAQETETLRKSLSLAAEHCASYSRSLSWLRPAQAREALDQTQILTNLRDILTVDNFHVIRACIPRPVFIAENSWAGVLDATAMSLELIARVDELWFGCVFHLSVLGGFTLGFMGAVIHYRLGTKSKWSYLTLVSSFFFLFAFILIVLNKEAVVTTLTLEAPTSPTVAASVDEQPTPLSVSTYVTILNTGFGVCYLVSCLFSKRVFAEWLRDVVWPALRPGEVLFNLWQGGPPSPELEDSFFRGFAAAGTEYVRVANLADNTAALRATLYAASRQSTEYARSLFWSLRTTRGNDAASQALLYKHLGDVLTPENYVQVCAVIPCPVFQDPALWAGVLNSAEGALIAAQALSTIQDEWVFNLIILYTFFIYAVGNMAHFVTNTSDIAAVNVE
jgi:hypothetical protein